MKFLPLIWAALLRKPGEALLTLLAVTAAFTLFSVMIGMNLTVQQIVQHSRMDRLWVDPRFPDQSTVSGLPHALSGQLAHIDGVTGVGALRWFGGYHVDPHSSVGILTVDDGMRSAWPEGLLTAAQWDSLSAAPSGIFVSVKAAAKWGLKAGDVFIVTADPGSRADGGISWDFQVLGVVPEDWDFSQSENGFILGNSRYIDEAAPAGRRGLGFSFVVALKDAARAVETSTQIDQRYANSGTATLTVPQRLDAQSQVQRGLDTTFTTSAIAATGLFMILFLTGSAITRSVRERIPEFAALQTVGFRNGHLVLLVFVEAVIPCLLGAALGTMLSGLLDGWSTHFLPGSLAQFLSAPTPTLAVLSWALGAAVLLAWASCAIPLLKLRHMSVTDALAGR